MGKNIIDFKDDELVNVKKTALTNDIKINYQNLVDLLIKVFNDVYNHLDSEDFKIITGLKK